MTQAITIIKREHRNLGAVLGCLDALVNEVDKSGTTPDFRVFHAIIDYLGGFLDRYHHPKENNYLMPALRRRFPDCAGLLDEIEAQHHQGDEHLEAFREALSAYEYGGPEKFPRFRDVVRDYVAFQLKHAHTEEREVLPLARRHLEDEDWEAIDAAFLENSDPLFGEARRQEYDDLFKTIVTLAPAPYGAGPEWKHRS
jgi:branched-chain amino acid transport system ATP-binding protein